KDYLNRKRSIDNFDRDFLNLWKKDRDEEKEIIKSWDQPCLENLRSEWLSKKISNQEYKECSNQSPNPRRDYKAPSGGRGISMRQATQANSFLYELTQPSKKAKENLNSGSKNKGNPKEETI